MTPSPLRLKRIAAGLTQADLALRAGISQQALSKLEKGERRISPQHAEMLAPLLDCRPAELLPDLALYQNQPDTEGAIELELLQLFRRATERDRQATMSLLRTLTAETSKAKASVTAN